MIIVKRYVKKNGQRVAVYLVFATNMSARKARRAISRNSSEYKKRWAIETGYRTVNKSRARTKSNSLSARLFLFHFSLTIQNVWAMVNFEADTQRTRSGLLEMGRTPGDRRAAAQVRGRGRKPRRWQRHWRNAVTMDGMLDRLRMIADKMLCLTDEGRPTSWPRWRRQRPHSARQPAASAPLSSRSSFSVAALPPRRPLVFIELPQSSAVTAAAEPQMRETLGFCGAHTASGTAEN